MSAGRNLVKSAILLITLVVAVSLGASASEWEINPLGAPNSYDTISPYGGTVQYVDINDRDTGDPITRQYLESREGRTNWRYYSNGTYQTGTLMDEGNLTHLNDGIWYVRQEVSNLSGQFLFEAERGNPYDQEANITKDITVSNVSVDIVTDHSQPYFPGRQDARIEVNVTNSTSGDVYPSADVQVRMTRPQAFDDGGQSFPSSIDNGLYRLYSMNIPDVIEKQYAMHVIVDEAGETSVNTEFIDTMDYLNTSADRVIAASGCDSETMPESCEPGAELDIGLNVTAAYADNVTLNVMKHNVEGGLVVEDSMMLSENKSSGLWEGNVTYPDLDTSGFEDHIALQFVSRNNYSQHTEYYNISKASFKLAPDMQSQAYQGSEYDIRFNITTPYTDEPYNSSKFSSANLEFQYPNGTIYRTLTKDNLSYSDDTGLATGSLIIGQGTPNGTYTLDADVDNFYGTNNSFTYGFEVLETSRIFDAEDSIEIDLGKQGNYSQNFTVDNELSNSITVEAVLDGDIEEFTEVNNGENIEIGPQNSTNVTVNFTVDDVQDYSGTIELHDTSSDYNESVSVELDGPPCGMRNGTICVDQDEDINVTRFGQGISNRTFQIYYMGDQEDVEVEIMKNGSVADHLSISNTSFNLTDSMEITVNYTVEQPMNETGNIFINSTRNLEIPTKLLGDFEDPEVEMNIVSNTLDLGVIQALEPGFQAQAQNNGTTDINYIESSDINVTNYNPIGPASTGPVTLNISRSSYGMMEEDVALTAYRQDPSETEEDLTGSTDSIEVVAWFMPETEAAVENITSWTQELNGRATSASVIGDIQSARDNATLIEDELSKGNDKEAYNTYQDTLSRLESIESEIESSENTGGPGDTDEQGATDEQEGQSPDEPDTGGPSDTGSSPETEGSGAGILPIIIIVFILLLAGFIFYTSYIPEPGDPLYEYLGEDQ